MPSYQFVCTTCEYMWDITERITEAPRAEEQTCIMCKGRNVVQSWEGGKIQWSFKERFK